MASRDQRAGPGPHAAPRPRRRARRRAGGSTGARPSARCRRPRPCSTPRSRSSTTTASSATATRQVPPDAAGVEIHGDWDALGMRASGSHSVTLHRRRGAARPRCAAASSAGDAEAYMDRNLVAGLFHASASLGIAEAAASVVARGGCAAGRPAATRARRRERDRARRLPGDAGARRARWSTTRDERLVALFAEAQAAKTFVNEAAARIVDRALALSGGAGYLNGHPLARAYRDVRAGSLHAPARRQPRLRPARRRRARPRRSSCTEPMRVAPAGQPALEDSSLRARSAASRPASRSSRRRSAARRSG